MSSVSCPVSGVKFSLSRSVFDALRGRGQQQSSSLEPQSETEDREPRELPADLWSSSLQSLYLHNNKLKWLPSYLGRFGALTRLDISGYVCHLRVT